MLKVHETLGHWTSLTHSATPKSRVARTPTASTRQQQQTETEQIVCSTQLTVRFLPARAGTRSAELLRLAAARVGDQQTAVILDQKLPDLLLGGLIDVCMQRQAYT